MVVLINNVKCVCLVNLKLPYPTLQGLMVHSWSNREILSVNVYITLIEFCCNDMYNVAVMLFIKNDRFNHP